MFKRFDNFNDSYNPLADPNLRAIFMKSSNKIEGEYFAGLCKTVFDRLQKSTQTKTGCRNQKAEPRLSIYGRNAQEWDQLGKWFVQHVGNHVSTFGIISFIDSMCLCCSECCRWTLQQDILQNKSAG